MIFPIRTAFLLILLPCSVFPDSLRNEDSDDLDPEPEPPSWNEIMKELNSIEETWLQPNSESGLNPKVAIPSIHIFSASLGAGYGYSNNFLKSKDPTGAYFTQIETDLFYSWITPSDFSLTAFAFGQFKGYDSNFEISDETIALAEIKAEKTFFDLKSTFRINYFYGDQIYDSSLSSLLLTNSDRLRQHQPKGSLDFVYQINPRNQLEVTFSGGYVFFDQSNLDYYFKEFSPTLRTVFNQKWESAFSISLSQETYIEELAREPNTTSSNKGTLILNALELVEELDFKPFSSLPLTLTLKAYGEWRDDNGGGYENRFRYGVSPSAYLKFKKMSFRLRGRFYWVDYSKRTTTFLGSELVEQSGQSLSFSFVQKLPLDFDATIEVDWGRLQSRINSDEYEETSLSLTIHRSF